MKGSRRSPSIKRALTRGSPSWSIRGDWCASRQLTERVDALQPALTPRLDRLQATIARSSRDIAHVYASLPDTQKAIISAVVQQELDLQLAPLKKLSGWLTAICAASLL